ncbi:hypothetical protein BGZ52_012727 [Haplosporangium bisporale]|nr:hypothetical protein BGZ52_012727 [Haplosporangium bisporale]
MTMAQYQQHVEKEYQAMREKSTKKRVADRILGIDWNLGLAARQVADLDLTFYQDHAHLKTWKVFRLDYKDQGLPKEPLDASQIENTLAHHLSPYFNNHVQAKQDEELIWIRISVNDGLAPNTLPASSTVIYFIWFTNSEYLLSGTIKAEWRDFILAAILRLFRASEAEEWPLSGKSPSSLAELLQPFPIKISMEGLNVIDGLKDMIPLGLNTSNQALPPFLSELHSMAANSLTVDLEEGSDSKQRITKGD